MDSNRFETLYGGMMLAMESIASHGWIKQPNGEGMEEKQKDKITSEGWNPLILILMLKIENMAPSSCDLVLRIPAYTYLLGF